MSAPSRAKNMATVRPIPWVYLCQWRADSDAPEWVETYAVATGDNGLRPLEFVRSNVLFEVWIPIVVPAFDLRVLCGDRHILIKPR
jgi:hypothetical protein